MQRHEQISRGDQGLPRTPQQEIAELLAAGLLRLRALPELIQPDGSGGFLLAMSPHQSVHANPYQNKGVHA
jgi:hypothetical protein